jgi:hypothetical protein
MNLDLDLLRSGLWTAISIGLVIAAYRYVLVPTLRAEFRQTLFAIRRKLFLYMAAGNIAPNHPAYVSLRSSINRLLRFIEHCTFGRILIAIFMPTLVKEHVSHFTSVLATVENPLVRNKLLEFKRETNTALVAVMIESSPFGIAFVAVTLVLLLAALAITYPFRLLRRIWGKIMHSKGVPAPEQGMGPGPHTRVKLVLSPTCHRTSYLESLRDHAAEPVEAQAFASGSREELEEFARSAS